MAIPPHIEARLAIHAKLRALLELGCERWQAADEKLSLAAFRRKENRKLKFRTFLDEEFDNAAYKFWRACEQGTKTPEQAWIETERAFQQFMGRLRRSGDPHRVKWFEPFEQEIQQFENDFAAYWEIEKKWLQPIQKQRENLKLFAKIGGREMNRAIRGGDSNGRLEFSNWCNEVIAKQYELNNYRQAALNGQAVIDGCIQFASSENGDDEKLNILDALSEVACINANVGINTRYGNAEDIFQRWCNSFSLVERQFIGDRLVFKYSFCIELLFQRINGRKSEMACSHAFMGVLTRFHQSVHKRNVMGETQLHRSIFLFELLAVNELLNLRTQLLREEQYFAGDMDFASLAELSMQRFNSNDIYFGDPKFVMDDIRLILEQPEDISLYLWNSATTWTQPPNNIVLSSIAGANARVWLDKERWSAEKAAHWIIEARNQLVECPNYLAWSEIYSLCEEYMKQRGNKVMVRAAKLGQQKMQLKALKGDVPLGDFDSQLALF